MNNCINKEVSVDEVLRELIKDTDLIEVICCLDMIATESGSRVAMFNWEGRQYPANGGDLLIPPPDWSLNKIKTGGQDVEENETETEWIDEPDDIDENIGTTGSENKPIKNETSDNDNNSANNGSNNGKSEPNG